MVRFNGFAWFRGLSGRAAWLAVAVVLSLFMVALSASRYTPVRAAGWLDQLFGDYRPRVRRYLRVRRARPAPVKRARARRPSRRRGLYVIGRVGDAIRPKRKVKKKTRIFRIPRSKTRLARARGGTYRTMCVRTCDGYFFPVSFATTRTRFKADARACASRCRAAPARLYYYPNPGGEIKDMVSYKGGEKYSKLKRAFLFTKRFVADCRCNPEPWTEEARQRHKIYALLESRKKQKLAVRRKLLRKRRLSRRWKKRRRGRRQRYYRRLASGRRSPYVRTIGRRNRPGRFSSRQ